MVTALLLVAIVAWGIITAPFGWKVGFLPSDPVPVDAIPDIGENQQIVFTEWKGRSPQDIEDQISYPLTTSLLGIAGVKTIRSSSIFGTSTIFIIFDEDVDFYWSRSRILEKLNSLPKNLLPDGVTPTLGPDATGLGQIFWYTLEGRDKEGNPTGGWDLHEIRSAQDFYVKYGLSAVDGVSEVASIGGYVKEYQVDVNPDAMKAYGISLKQVIKAVKESNRDVGAKTIEINQAEYFVRGLGYVKSVADLEMAVVDVQDNVPIRIKDVAVVHLGPETRRGVLDKDGAEVVGGVVIARYGANPLAVINRVKSKIREISSGLPSKTLSDGRVSQLTVVPFYDRTQLINETLGTLEEALSLEVVITVLVIVVMMLNLRASILVSGLLPIAILLVFVGMRYVGVDANIVALSGIAIAIGTMVDLGIVLSENVLSTMDEHPEKKLVDSIYTASSEVSGAIVTAVSTTIVSFLPVFLMESAEGKLFRPLAWTKTFALVGALIVALLILPTLAYWMFRGSTKYGVQSTEPRRLFRSSVLKKWSESSVLRTLYSVLKKEYLVALCVTYLLAQYWMPLGPDKSLLMNALFVGLLVGLVLGGFYLLERYYLNILSWTLANKGKFLLIPATVMVFGLFVWQGFDSILGFIPKAFDRVGWNVRTTKLWSSMSHEFSGIGQEFMPSLDEGSFLLMPTSMPHAGVEQNKRVVQQLDMLVANIPEVDLVVGKMGRANTAMDPAPISMYENIINYKPEFLVNEKGHRIRFKVDDKDRFILRTGDAISNQDALKQGVQEKDLVPDKHGQYFRNWREHITSPDDIWKEIVKVTKLPGVTSAPKLQPIETRLVMLQTGMRAPMGIKVFGPDLKTIEAFGRELEGILKNVPSVKAEAVFADRIVGKPYLHLNINRSAIARYGLSIEMVQQVIESAIGGMPITTTVEGRERYPVRVRYPRELRDSPDKLAEVLMPTPTDAQVPLGELVDFEYVQGPQAIKSENTFLLGYVLFDKQDGFAEVDVVNDAQQTIQQRIDDGSLVVPAGISFKFSGNYENQVRAQKRLSIIVPVVLGVVFLILYFQFRSVSTSLMIFTGIAMAFSGAFMMLWLYGQDWFLNVSVFGGNFREVFQMRTINLSVAVWVGFIALFGIATDDGVLIGTYLDQSFKKHNPKTLQEIRKAVAEAGHRRIKPAILTSATTLIALLPVLSSTGRGSDIMIPMAIPAFGGMIVACISYFIVPVLYALREELQLKKRQS